MDEQTGSPAALSQSTVSPRDILRTATGVAGVTGVTGAVWAAALLVPWRDRPAPETTQVQRSASVEADLSPLESGQPIMVSWRS